MITLVQSEHLGFLPKLVIALAVALLAAGAIRYDLTAETLQRMWNDFVNRPGGLMTFRFLLQPPWRRLPRLMTASTTRAWVGHRISGWSFTGRKKGDRSRGGFWSLSMYDRDFMLPNPPNGRTNVGTVSLDANELKFAADGSFTIHMSHEPPADADAKTNWLPRRRVSSR